MMNRNIFQGGLDERARDTLRQSSSIMYFITLLALVGAIMYRQIALEQSVQEFQDLALILTANVLVFILAVLYLGTISLRRIRFKTVISIFMTMLILGSITGLVLNKFSNSTEYLHYMFRVGGVSLILIALYAAVAYLGQRRLSRLSEQGVSPDP